MVASIANSLGCKDMFDLSVFSTINVGRRTNTKTKTLTKKNTFREHLKRAIPKNCDL